MERNDVVTSNTECLLLRSPKHSYPGECTILCDTVAVLREMRKETPCRNIVTYKIKTNLQIFSFNFGDQPVAEAANLFHFLWRFDSIPCHDLPLQGFTTPIIEHTTLGRVPLDE
jgi:hypothetical protein